jgi:release factor glutamine methyltransferase
MTRKELIDSIKSAAKPVYGSREAATIARLVAEKRYGFTRADLALEPHAEVNMSGSDRPTTDEESAMLAFEKLLADLAAARPVQYILGSADFDGLELVVGKGVLIPRPETEELVRWIASDDATAKTILDVGTGSGAIAIALAKRLPEASVTAIDVSPEALAYAFENNLLIKAYVNILWADLFDDSLDPGLFNVIVSNPPYIPASERAQMAANVTEHEPSLALFVPDDDPLVFYRAIARRAHRLLAPDGALYFEIHESAAQAVTELLKAEGFREIEVRDDINSKPRMVKCRL